MHLVLTELCRILFLNQHHETINCNSSTVYKLYIKHFIILYLPIYYFQNGDTTEEEYEQYFAAFGKTSDCVIIKDPKTGKFCCVKCWICNSEVLIFKSFIRIGCIKV